MTLSDGASDDEIPPSLPADGGSIRKVHAHAHTHNKPLDIMSGLVKAPEENRRADLNLSVIISNQFSFPTSGSVCDQALMSHPLE